MIRILYVDDSREILDIGKTLLEINPNFRVDTTISGTDALALLKQKTYHAIISDYFMPDKDGITFLKQVREYNKTIPFIIFTGRGDESIVIEALNNGADFYLKKGQEVRTLFTEISQIIQILISKTESKEKLTSSEEKFRILSESTHAAILIYQDDRWIYANPAAEKITEYSVDELKLMKYWEIFHPDYQNQIRETGKARQLGDEIAPKSTEIKIITKSGKEHWIDYVANTISIEDKIGGLITGIDVSERKESEFNLAQSEEKYRSIFENLIDIYYYTDINGTIRNISPSCKKILGFFPDELIGRSSLELYPNNKQRDDFINSLWADKIVKNLEIELLNSLGSPVPVSISGHIIYGSTGLPIGVEGTIRDISDRKQIEDALTKSKREYHSLFEHMLDGYAYCQIIYDEKGYPKDWRYLDVNDSFERLTGLTNTTGKLVSEILPGINEQMPELFEILNKVCASGNPGIFEVEFKKYHIWLHFSIYQPEPDYFITILENITKRKQDETTLQHLVAQYKTILVNVPSMIWYKDTDHAFIKINPTAAKVFGKTPAEIEGKRFEEIFPDKKDIYRADDIEIIQTGKPKLGLKEQLITAQGEHIWVQSDKVPLKDESGIIFGILVVSTDITERIKTKEAIILANKKLNLLANITRHDIVNQLQGLFLALDLLKTEDLSVTTQENITRINFFTKNIERQIAFTRDYQDIGLKSPIWQDLQAIIQTVISSFEWSYISIEVDIDNIEIFADPLLEKVFHNLIENSIKYGEKITQIHIYDTKGPEEYCIICSDDGIGIPAKYKKGIFKREYYRHTGFGLNLSKEILEITGITIKETGEEGIGARFEITVPKGNFRYVN
ncbi:hypothetical protein DK846_05650 [Methanospirillum lacunae]|uniref:histidine kinase n=2 Tax=Methanospirillum lacunae TaxID=668570 RepID=A0A2V2N9T8_9EURY|nr:hypothetical protein DK846_05650 [Methanospirillum lacunae]